MQTSTLANKLARSLKNRREEVTPEALRAELKRQLEKKQIKTMGVLFFKWRTGIDGEQERFLANGRVRVLSVLDLPQAGEGQAGMEFQIEVKISQSTKWVSEFAQEAVEGTTAKQELTDPRTIAVAL